MSESRSPASSSSSRSTPTDADLSEMGVDPSAKGFVDAFLVVLAGLMMAGSWMKGHVVHNFQSFVAWNRADSRNLLLTVGLVTTLVGVVAWNSGPSEPDPVAPPVVTTPAPVGSKVMKAKHGDSYKGIAAANGVAWETVVRANIGLVRTNTTWCEARVIDGVPVSKEYLAGLMPDGKTSRRSNFCVTTFTFDGESGLALETLRERQDVIVPLADPRPPTIALAATAPRPE